MLNLLLVIEHFFGPRIALLRPESRAYCAKGADWPDDGPEHSHLAVSAPGILPGVAKSQSVGDTPTSHTDKVPALLSLRQKQGTRELPITSFNFLNS
jgi:hypothetical protein